MPSALPGKSAFGATRQGVYVGVISLAEVLAPRWVPPALAVAEAAEGAAGVQAARTAIAVEAPANAPSRRNPRRDSEDRLAAPRPVADFGVCPPSAGAAS